MRDSTRENVAEWNRIALERANRMNRPRDARRYKRNLLTLGAAAVRA